MADQDKAADGSDDDKKKSPTGVISSICRRLFGGGNKVQNEHTNEEKNNTSDDGPPAVHRIVAPRGATDDEYVESPPSKEANDTTDLSERVDGSLYAGDESVAVVHPADKDVNIIGGKRKRGRQDLHKQVEMCKEIQCNAETEDDWRGVEHTASVLRQSLVDPPTSSPKSKRCKKNLNNGQRKRHKKSTPKSRESLTEETKDPSTGARFVQNKNTTLIGLTSGGVSGTNNRTCMPLAIAALLQDYPEIMDAVLASLLSAMPDEGDMKSSQAGKALVRHGMWLERVGRMYNKKGGYPYHLLQEYDCKLIIHIKLTNTKKQDMNHCIAWDGTTLHDQPQSIKVNDTFDRHPTKPHYAKKVFNKLYPKDKFHSWQITNVFQLHGVVSAGGTKKKSLIQ